MKIAISNPSKQYTHQTVAAFSNNPNYEVYFLTSFWFLPKNIWWHGLLNKQAKISKQLKKKSANIVPAHTVVMDRTGIFFSFFGRFLYKGEERSYKEDRIHDKWTTKWVKKNKPDIFIGHEKSCLNAFKKVKQYGGITILDLAQVHINFIEKLRNEYEFFKNITGDERLFNLVKKTKLEEYRLADHITVLSSFAKDTLINNRIEKSRIYQPTLGFNPSLFKAKTDYKVVTKRSLRLIFSGTITPRKGLHLLLDLMTNELKEFDITLDIIGPMSEGIDLNNYLSNHIQYYSFLPHEVLAEKLSEADVFVFPSYLDSWAMVVVEAMAAGLPVIVTKNTGARDVVQNNENGFVIDIDDKEILKDKILHFYQNRYEIERMGKNAAASIQPYTWNNYYDSMNEIINAVS